MAVQQLLRGMLPPGWAQYSLQHSCSIVAKLFLHTLSQCQCGASVKQY